ncbi:hypothetical protein L209DRAFT_756854 [Thermothelomyces heterothallicus CBS 203.75]
MANSGCFSKVALGSCTAILLPVNSSKGAQNKGHCFLSCQSVNATVAPLGPRPQQHTVSFSRHSSYNHRIGHWHAEGPRCRALNV